MSRLYKQYINLSHQHNDLYDLAYVLLGKTFSYSDEFLKVQEKEHPYNHWDFHSNTYSEDHFNDLSKGKIAPKEGVCFFHRSSLSNFLISVNEEICETQGIFENYPILTNHLLWICASSSHNSSYSSVHHLGKLPTETWDNILAIPNSRVLHGHWKNYQHDSYTSIFRSRCESMSNQVVTDWNTRMRVYAYNLLSSIPQENDQNKILYYDELIEGNYDHYKDIVSFCQSHPLSQKEFQQIVNDYRSFVYK